MNNVLEMQKGSASGRCLERLLAGGALYELQLRLFGGTLVIASEVPKGYVLVGILTDAESIRLLAAVSAYIRSCAQSALRRNQRQEEESITGCLLAFKADFIETFSPALKRSGAA